MMPLFCFCLHLNKLRSSQHFFFFSKLPDMLWVFEYLSLKYINRKAFCHSLFLLLTGIHTKLKTCQGVCIARHTYWKKIKEQSLSSAAKSSEAINNFLLCGFRHLFNISSSNCKIPETQLQNDICRVWYLQLLSPSSAVPVHTQAATSRTSKIAALACCTVATLPLRLRNEIN